MPVTKNRLAAVFAIGLALSLFAVGAAVADTEDTSVTDIGADHPLDTNQSVHEWESGGHVSGDLTRYQIGLAAAEDGTDVGLDPSMTRDLRNHYLRIDYDESASRTLRVLLPREYITPYTMESVEAFDSDHVASYEPARGGEYLAITIHFDGSGSAVLPLQRDSSASYGIVERVDRRVEQIAGFSPLGRGGEWQYIEGDAVAETAAYPINASADEILIQYDARPGESEEVWINAPRGETAEDLVYFFERENDGEQELHVVSATGQPDVRVKENAGRSDRYRGDINELRLVPDRIRDGFDRDWWPFGGD